MDGIDQDAAVSLREIHAGRLTLYTEQPPFEEWPEVVAAQTGAQRDPKVYQFNHTKNDQIYRRFLTDAADLVDIMTGTPVALADFAKHVDWVPDLIEVGEAACLSEDVLLISSSKA
ncbi:hypothetical protein FGRMN_1425 [Fusarium graminum]|nr:hypothetical protein FGRMN_1425 [Fusarium graminum]